MSQAIIPWEMSTFPSELVLELNRRKTNRSFNYISSDKGGWDSTTRDWVKYKGPMVPWSRFCSNGYGKIYKTDKNGNPIVNDDGTNVMRDSSEIKPGFVFFGGKDFYSGYGFNQSEKSPSIIGYVPDGTGRTHTIDNDLKNSNYPIHVPAPEIEKISVTIQKELFRRASVEWTCFSKRQLEYMTPYFLVPGLSCILEWGWNHYNPVSLLDLSNTSDIKEKFNNPYPLYTNNILKSSGNYDVIMGIITNFEWSMDGNKIKCKTEITSKDRIYAGIMLDSSITIKSDDKSNSESENPMNSVAKFFENTISQFRAVSSAKDITKIPNIQEFIKYEQHSRPNNWESYVYGVFYGRDLEGTSIKPLGTSNPKLGGAFGGALAGFSDSNPSNDFDKKSTNKDLWINMGLVIDAINFHTDPLSGMSKKEMFKVDIDDVVIGAHPNLISTDGNIALIPNARSPKYFYGQWGVNAIINNIDPTHQITAAAILGTLKDIAGNVVGYPQQVADARQDDEEESIKIKGTSKPVASIMTKEDAATKPGGLADYKVRNICAQRDGTYRDNIDEIINRIRYEYNDPDSNESYEFPFYSVKKISDINEYPAQYSGYLKNIYVSVNHIKTIIGNVKTYTELINKILEDINSCCGNFWDFRLVNGTGKEGMNKGDIATMKIVDYKFMASINKGVVYTFDYFDADSLLLGMSFKPTISNAQAIRSIYAPTNNPNRKIVLTNGTNELLDYHFTDRLFAQDEQYEIKNTIKDHSGFMNTMKRLQRLTPDEGSFQMTIGNNIYRLAMPNATDVLQLLLDDGDTENNPKYTGIMPGIQATFTIQGIGGLRTFMVFLVRNLPEPYSDKNIVFRIVDVQESIESGKWITTITAGVIPLRGFIKKRLGIT